LGDGLVHFVILRIPCHGGLLFQCPFVLLTSLLCVYAIVPPPSPISPRRSTQCLVPKFLKYHLCASDKGSAFAGPSIGISDGYSLQSDPCHATIFPFFPFRVTYCLLSSPPFTFHFSSGWDASVFFPVRPPSDVFPSLDYSLPRSTPPYLYLSLLWLGIRRALRSVSIEGYIPPFPPFEPGRRWPAPPHKFAFLTLHWRPIVQSFQRLR